MSGENNTLPLRQMISCNQEGHFSLLGRACLQKLGPGLITQENHSGISAALTPASEPKLLLTTRCTVRSGGEIYSFRQPNFLILKTKNSSLCQFLALHQPFPVQAKQCNAPTHTGEMCIFGKKKIKRSGHIHINNDLFYTNAHYADLTFILSSVTTERKNSLFKSTTCENEARDATVWSTSEQQYIRAEIK